MHTKLKLLRLVVKSNNLMTREQRSKARSLPCIAHTGQRCNSFLRARRLIACAHQRRELNALLSP